MHHDDSVSIVTFVYSPDILTCTCPSYLSYTMFLYHFDSSYPSQSIVSHYDDTMQVWAWMRDEQDHYYIVLGTTIYRPHLYKITQAPAQLSLCQTLTHNQSMQVSDHTLSLIHQLVYEYYTTYTNIIKLFIPSDISKLLAKSAKATKSKPQYHPIIKSDNTLAISDQLQSGQQCIIMPDRWTIINYRDEWSYDLKECIGSQHTSLQDIKWYWNLKCWLTSRIIATPAQCFWEFDQLTQIVVIDPHKRYYKSQQDPRYDIMRVAELMAHTYQCELITNH